MLLNLWHILLLFTIMFLPANSMCPMGPIGPMEPMNPVNPMSQVANTASTPIFDGYVAYKSEDNITFTGIHDKFADYVIDCPVRHVTITNVAFEIKSNKSNDDNNELGGLIFIQTSTGWELYGTYCNDTCYNSINLNGTWCQFWLRYNGTLTFSYTLRETYMEFVPSPTYEPTPVAQPSPQIASGDNNSHYISPEMIAAIIVCVVLGATIIGLLIFFAIKYDWFEKFKDAMRA